MIDQAEDPRKIIEQTITDMQSEEKKVKENLIEVMALLKRSEAEFEKNRQKAQEWEDKAMQAVKLSNDDLARKALEEKQSCDNLAEEHRAAIEQQNIYVEELKKGMSALAAKVEEAKKKKIELIAKLNTAEMKQRNQATDVVTKDHLSDSNAFDTFDRMSEKIETSEAQSGAMMDLMSDEAKTEQLDAEVDAAFQEQNSGDALAALKSKMSGQVSQEASTDNTSNNADPIEDEIAKMRAALEGDTPDNA
jgi:phage shock protein A